MSAGPFPELPRIIKKRMQSQGLGFTADSHLQGAFDHGAFYTTSGRKILIEFGFESEFVGRLPVVAVLDPLAEEDLYAILKNHQQPHHHQQEKGLQVLRH